MQSQATRLAKAQAALEQVVSMFESGQLPEAIGRAAIRRLEADSPSAEWSLGNQLLMFLAGTDDARGSSSGRTPADT